MKIGLYSTHPAADAYPLLEGPDLSNFTAAIEQDGQREEIVLLRVGDETVILDGRNRYIACLALGIEPRFRYFDETTEGDPVAFVKSKNNDRRHQERISRVLSLSRLVEVHRRESKRLKRQDALPGVDLNTAQMVKAISEDGSPELVAAVHAGEVDAAHAAALSQLEPEEQREGIERIKAQQAEPEKPVRAKQEQAGITITLTPRDVVALTSALRVCGTEMAAVFARLASSVHPEAVEGGKVLRRVLGSVAQ